MFATSNFLVVTISVAVVSSSTMMMAVEGQSAGLFQPELRQWPPCPWYYYGRMGGALNGASKTFCTLTTAKPPAPSPTAATTTTVTPKPIDPPSADSLEFMVHYGKAQNDIRTNHRVGPLVQDNTLADKARVCARKFALENPPPHNDPQQCAQVGEIHDYGERKATMLETATEVLDAWYTTKRPQVNFNNPMPDDATHHLTQIIWKASTKYGCAIEFTEIPVGTGTHRHYFVSCVYEMAGNNGENGGYAQNVLPPIS